MISKEVTYEDYNGKTVKKTFHFNLNKSDAMEFKYRKDGSDIVDVISRIMADENIRGILDILKELARSSVGRKVETDGEVRFIKDDEARSQLFDTDAYSELMFELLDKEENAANFITGMLPKDMVKNMEEITDGKDMKNMSKDEIAKKMRELEELRKNADN